MFGKGLFKSRKGPKDDKEAAESVLPRHAATSSFATTPGNNGDYSLDAHSFGQLTPDLIISPTNHRAPLSSYARSVLQRDDPYSKQAAGSDIHFDDVSSMNDDSIYFGTSDTNPIEGFSSPIRAELHSQMLANAMSPGVSTILNDNDNDTDIQSVATGHAFSTIMSPSIRSELRPDADSSVVQRPVGPVKTNSSPSASNSGETEKETPVNSPKEKDESSIEPSRGFCARIRRAPLWLRIVFIGSILLFMAAVLLAVIGLMVTSGTANAKSNNRNVAQINDGDDDGFNPNYVPDVAEVPNDPIDVQPEPEGTEPTQPEPVDPPPSEPEDKTDEVASTTSPTIQLTVGSTTAPQMAPSMSPIQQKSKESPTDVPVASPIQTFAPALVNEEETQAPAPSPPEMTVYITSGFLPEALKLQAETLLPKLPGTEQDTFLVHLGDWNDINTSQSCTAIEFQKTADFYAASSVPVYWTVGDNEFNDCPSPPAALQLWKNIFVGYETQHWLPPPWTLFRQSELSANYRDYPENLVFEHGEIVYLTINLVGSRVHNEVEFETRLEANLAWVEFAYDFFKDTAKTFVIFAHAGPDNGNRANSQFYSDLLAAIEDDYADMTFVLVNRGTSKWGIKKKYDGISNLYSVSVPGPIFPPLKMVISDGEPEIVEVDWTTL